MCPLLVGPPICGEVLLQQAVVLSEVKVPEADKSTDKVPIPVGLKQRWKPFGWSKCCIYKCIIYVYYYVKSNLFVER